MIVLNKIAEAIEAIKQKNLKKKGYNSYSKYEYYTPDQVSELVAYGCKQAGLFYKYDLVRTEHGLEGHLTVFNLDDINDQITYIAATETPEITATNKSQQMGGTMTYSKRYMLMNTFEIVDNSLDFDTTENTESQVKAVKNIESLINNCTTIEELTVIWETYKSLHGDMNFIKLFSKKSKELKK